jgi:hypothetical protein
LLYFTTDCTRSTVKFWFLPLNIFPLIFSRHRQLVRFALVRFSIRTDPILPRLRIYPFLPGLKTGPNLLVRFSQG